MKLSSILGLNARSRLYLSHNNFKSRRIANSKLLTKRVLGNAGIPIPEIYVKFRKPEDVLNYDWTKLPSSFALKPSRGLGGEGIIVVKKKLVDGKWLTTQREKVSVDDLKLHTLDILEGAFSMGNFPDVAYIEEFVGRHKAFRKYSYRGTPDIRVIVFNKVPVMAMLRLPTKESGGRANLHQGAIGVGIDIATGITVNAVWHGNYIKYKPDTARKLNGIRVPDWTRVLELAVECQMASGLEYIGVDIVLHPEKGPMILEINASPGLQIQLANKAGLKKRLERVEELHVEGPEQGVKIAKAIFAERFADRVAIKEGIKTLHLFEETKIISGAGRRVDVTAKVDTGAWRSSIDRTLAQELGLLDKKNILWEKTFKSGIGKQKRQVIGLTYFLAGRKIKTIASVADRKGLRFRFIIGRKDLPGFVISPRKLLVK